MEKKDKKVVKPITVTDTTSNITYTLEFNRESVMYAERQGFNIADLQSRALSGILDLWYFSFRANHKGVSKETALRLLEDMGGMPDGLLERLVELYAEPYKVLIPSEDNSKNSKVVVEF